MAHVEPGAVVVMRAQDDERRRIAQTLHATTAQDLETVTEKDMAIGQGIDYPGSPS
jgi:signal transduction histidine kinase